MDDIAPFVRRPWVANDPAVGVALWRAVPDDVEDGCPLLVVGAAAGLELVADRLDPTLRWRPGARRGVDVAPIDVRDEAALRWLLAVCPPDDVERFERTRHAITLAQETGVRVETGDAVEAVRALPGEGPLVVMGGSVLCSLDEPAALLAALDARTGPTWLVAEEAVGVHRMVGTGAGLEDREPSDRAAVVRRS